MTQTLRDKIARIVWNARYRDGEGTSNDVADAILDVIRGGVKPLKFEAAHNGSRHAHSFGSVYIIDNSGPDFVFSDVNGSCRFPVGSGDTPEEAAQKHNLLRILSALGLSTPEQEAGNE